MSADMKGEMIAGLSEGWTVAVSFGALFAGVAIVPGLITFARPSWIRAIFCAGVVLAFAAWVPSWFGDTGDMNREDSVILVALWILALLVFWAGGASLGRRVRGWLKPQTDTRPA